jgi:hypothetical protein
MWAVPPWSMTRRSLSTQWIFESCHALFLSHLATTPYLPHRLITHTLLSTMPHNYVAPKFPPRRAPMIPESDSDDSTGESQTPPSKRAKTLSTKARENSQSTYILSERQCVETGDQWWEGVSLYRYSPKLGRSNRDRLLQMDTRCDLR